MSEGTKFTNLAYPESSTETPRVWARCWTVRGNGIVVHVFRDGGRTTPGGESDRQEEAITRLNRIEGVQNLGEVPDEMDRSTVLGVRQVFVTGFIPLDALLAAVLAELETLLGIENVILAQPDSRKQDDAPESND